MRAFALFAPHESAYCGMSLKLAMNGLAYPFVICKETPSSIEKMKNTAIFLSLNKLKAFSPSAS